MDRIQYKAVQNYILYITILVILAAFYVENTYNLIPCPLCMMQRLCVFLVGFLSLWAFGVKSLRRAQVLSIWQLVIAILGIYFASRQLWLQSLPVDAGKMCLPGLQSVLSYLSYTEILHALFWGSGECSEVTWRFLGITMPAWCLIYFIGIGLANIYVNVLLYIQRRSKIDNK